MMMTNMQTPKRGTRFERQRVARIMSIQAIYEANHQNQNIEITLSKFINYKLNHHNHPNLPDKELCSHLLNTVFLHKDAIQQTINRSTTESWSINNIDPVIIAILQTALAELINSYQGIPVSVVVSEYIEICKGFCATKDANYLHKVLDNYLKSKN